MARAAPCRCSKCRFLAGDGLGWVGARRACAGGRLVWLAGAGGAQWHLAPLTLKQLRRFRAIRRGYVSFLILLALVGVASLDSLLVGKRALMVSYEGKWSTSRS